MKIATTKQRILQFIEYKHISKTLFFEKTGIKRGFLDSDKLNQAVSDDHFAKIIASFSDISMEWLISGNGEMLKDTYVKPVELENKVDYKEKYYTLLEDYHKLNEENRELRELTQKLKQKESGHVQSTKSKNNKSLLPV